MTTVLVVDDEPPIRQTMEMNLRARGYTVEVAATGGEAMKMIAADRPDAVILDLGLPDMDGVDLIESVRGWTSVPIIILSARTAQAQKVAALDAGADDYVTKPFGMDELMARLRAALRTPSGEGMPTVKTPDFTIDLAHRAVTLPDGTKVALTATEWQIVEILARNSGRLVTQRELLQQVWGITDSRPNSYVRVFMVAIRRKLEPDPSKPRYFLTEPAFGIRFMPEGAVPE